MKYIHGTDDKKDVVVSMLKRLLSLFFFVILCAACYAILLTISALVYGEHFSAVVLIVIIGTGGISLVMLIGISMAAWSNTRYMVSTDGIMIINVFTKNIIKWDNVKSISIQPLIHRGSLRKYIIIQLTDSLPLSGKWCYWGPVLNYTICYLQRKDFLSIRWTEARCQEIEFQGNSIQKK